MCRLFLSTATWDALRYCSQADASEAALAHIAAQSPSDDNSASINTASLVKVTAASHRLLPVRDDQCGSWRSSTEYVCSDSKSRSTSSSLRSRTRCCEPVASADNQASRLPPERTHLNYDSVNMPSIARQKVVRHAFLIGFDEILDQYRCADARW